MTPLNSPSRKTLLAAVLIASVLTVFQSFVRNATAQPRSPNTTSVDRETAEKDAERERLNKRGEELLKIVRDPDRSEEERNKAREEAKRIVQRLNEIADWYGDQRRRYCAKLAAADARHPSLFDGTCDHPLKKEQSKRQDVPRPSPPQPKLEPIAQFRNRLANSGLDKLIQLSYPGPDRITITELRNLTPSDAEKIVQLVRSESVANPGLAIEVPCSIARLAGQQRYFLGC